MPACCENVNQKWSFILETNIYIYYRKSSFIYLFIHFFPYLFIYLLMPGASGFMCYFHLHSLPVLTTLVHCIYFCFCFYHFARHSYSYSYSCAITSRFHLFLYVSHLCLQKPEILNLQARWILFNDSKNEKNSVSLKKRKQF